MITYQQEFLATVRKDAKELIKDHWEEIAVNKDTIKLNPDWKYYSELEKQRKFKVFTARTQEGKLVGYFATVVSWNPHYKDHLFAVNDVLFLHKDYRLGFTGIKLIKFAEQCLKEDGVSVLSINTKVHAPFDPIMNRLGYSNTERVYTKTLGD